MVNHLACPSARTWSTLLRYKIGILYPCAPHDVDLYSQITTRNSKSMFPRVVSIMKPSWNPLPWMVDRPAEEMHNLTVSCEGQLNELHKTRRPCGVVASWCILCSYFSKDTNEPTCILHRIALGFRRQRAFLSCHGLPRNHRSTSSSGWHRLAHGDSSHRCLSYASRID